MRTIPFQVLALCGAFSTLVSGVAVEQRTTKHLRPVREKRGQDPIVGVKGAPILGGSNEAIVAQNPSQLQPPPTDAGTGVPNLKWSFSLSNMLLSEGGFVREQVVQDLPASKEFSAAQNHVKKGAIRQMHWHDVNEWGIVTNGSVLVSVVSSSGQNQLFKADQGDIWYFPKGQGHAIQGLSEQGAEYLLVFDNGDFNALGTTFNIDDWLVHTPPSVLAKNFGLPKNSTLPFSTVPKTAGSINPGKVGSEPLPKALAGELTGNSSYYFPGSKTKFTEAPGKGGRYLAVDSTNFPISKGLAAQIVEVDPGAMRELHWHPNGGEWLYFMEGTARGTVWIGGGQARTFDFVVGDTAVFPDNSGHYIENTSPTQCLRYLEIFKSDHVEDFSLAQWMALTQPDMVAQILNISVEAVKATKKEKQVIVKNN
ncbi:oxalate decarboxylase [Tricladium varicosporioides]|nr:oxalate decarboxylase [Hymenoscyphus varicosporioides]